MQNSYGQFCNCTTKRYDNFDESKLNLIVDSSAITEANDMLCNHANTGSVYDIYQEQFSSSDIVSAGPVCCRAAESCAAGTNIRIMSTTKEPVICSGGRSCGTNGIPGDNVANINFNNEHGPVFCTGDSSCYKTNIVTTDNIYCFGEGSCNHGSLTAASCIYCSGDGSCQYSTISSSGDMNVYLLGSYAGRGSKIVCNSNDNCHIVCSSWHGCTDLELQCNGFCIVECGENTDCQNEFTAQPTSSTMFPISTPMRCPNTIAYNLTEIPSNQQTTAISTEIPSNQQTTSISTEIPVNHGESTVEQTIMFLSTKHYPCDE
eukprot:219202_1